MCAGKQAWALNFWWIINLGGSDKEKAKQKIDGSIFIYMRVTIPGTPSISLCRNYL
jgi:hypothetical protein